MHLVKKMDISVFDAHCDTALNIFENKFELLKNPGHTDLTRGGEYTRYAQIYAIWNEKGTVAQYKTQLEYLKAEFLKNTDKVMLCTSVLDAETAFAENKTAAFLAVEGAEQLDCSETELENAYNDGVRAVNITWNYENALSGSNVDAPDKGLTEKGRSFVRKCNELGILVDVSHISEPGFWDVLEVSQKPIIASHSNSKVLCPHPRNLTDEQFKALVKNGGVAGINLCADFLGVNPTVDTVIAHIERFLSLGGEKNIGLGTDFDGCDVLDDIAGLQDLGKLYEALLKRNYSENTVKDIFFNNMMSLMN